MVRVLPLACSFGDVGVSLRKPRPNTRMITTSSLGGVCFPHFSHDLRRGLDFCDGGALCGLPCLRCRCKPPRAQFKSENDVLGRQKSKSPFPRRAPTPGLPPAHPMLGARHPSGAHARKKTAGVSRVRSHHRTWIRSAALSIATFNGWPHALT